MSRRALLTGLGIGAVGASLAAPGAASAEEVATNRHNRLRFATFNIHHAASPDNVVDLERIATVIESMDVDVIGLQEVDRFWSRSDFVDQPQWFARRLRMWKAYAPNVQLPAERPGDPGREYGTLVLSKWPIIRRHNTLLPKFENGEQRGFLEVTVATPAGMPVHVATTHLQHNNNLEREAQATAIAEILGNRPRRTVVTGDFNAETGTPEISTIDSVVDDVWTAVGDGPGHTYNTIDPKVRIDYVWHSADLTPVSAEVVTDDPLASDHLPLVAEYKLRLH
ncbi:endonuclease/exonuclease/phosphatase family protein [Stackebrandtia albiflava]|uniref:endonuclease/exonuclease/phosphatase family protein n=1 Tax=Stackebrandtia albiflava TaxID=406432 RepID=UPI001FCEB493|nr:endonuclease/exonuclease/phosphatase family protein [Stackebrandtia albiflava]